MDEFLLHYEKVKPTTWVYLSSFLIIALYFKFNRLWSVRNLDLIGLILLAPGLLFVIYGQEKGIESDQQTGYIWLFVMTGLLLVRMLLDPVMVRRPLLEPNLTSGGLLFLGGALLVFLMVNVVAPDAPTHVIARSTASQEQPMAAAAPPQDQPAAADEADEEPLARYGPGFPYFLEFSQLPTRLLFADSEEAVEAPRGREPDQQQVIQLATARTVTILSHLAIVLGMVVIGYRHFDNIKTGIAAAVLYLLLPYTTIATDKAYHVLLGAFLVWTVVLYRRPLASGLLMGLAIGSFYYPIFLLPLWISFYWQRGVVRFLCGVLLMLAVLVTILYFRPHGPTFLADLRQMFGWIFPRLEHVHGFWGLPMNDPVFRIPVLAAFVIMCIALAIWPAQKNLGTLMSCSAAVMLGAQFWHALEGGQLMAWYLPLVLLTVFRPNLEDRVALSVLGEWPFGRRRPRTLAVERAG